MATKKQIDANRRNAETSTGPRTDEGKARSSQNALKHGLSAERVVIWDENPAEFEALQSDLVKHFRPTNPVADHLVEQVATCMWRLRRVPEIEAAIFSHFTLEATCEAEDDEEDDEAYAYDGPVPSDVKGEVFALAERPLTSLIRLAGQLERSMHRAIQELDRMKAEQSQPANASPVSPVIDVEPEPEAVILRPRPHLSEDVKARLRAERSTE